MSEPSIVIINSACIACQKRKAKCIGNPCAYCLKKDIVCEFKSAKKRGPKRLKLPVNSETDIVTSTILSQESMNVACQEQQFVDFYFQYIGRFIPVEFKSIVLSSGIEYKSQLYLITASIMKMHGNLELEIEYFNKANKACSLFNSDTLETAVTLMMMTNYLGENNPRAKNYISLAASILEMPNIDKNSLAITKARLISKEIAFLYDPSVSATQKAAHVLNLLNTDEVKQIAGASKADNLSLRAAKIINLIRGLAQYDDSCVASFIHSVSFYSPLNENGRVVILQEVDEMEKLMQTSNLDPSSFIYRTFLIKFFRFIIEWRSGNETAAFHEAVQTLKIIQESIQQLYLWLSTTMNILLVIPFFFEKCGAKDLMEESLKSIGEAVKTKKKKNEELWAMWAEMQGKKEIIGYNMAQLEADLFSIPSDPAPSPI